jgi:hypothetical protein
MVEYRLADARGRVSDTMTASKAPESAGPRAVDVSCYPRLVHKCGIVRYRVIEFGNVAAAVGVGDRAADCAEAGYGKTEDCGHC